MQLRPIGKKGKGEMVIWVGVVGVLLLLGIFGWAIFLKEPVQQEGLPGQPGESGRTVEGKVGPVSKQTCFLPDDGTNAITVNARNIENSRADYMTNSVVAVESDTGEVTGTLTGGIKTYTSLTVKACDVGKLYGLSSTSLNGFVTDYDGYAPTWAYSITSTNSSRLAIDIYDNTLTSIEGGAGPLTENTTAQTLGLGGSITGFMDIQANETTGAFGSKEGGFYINVDIGDLTAFSKTNGVTLNSQTAGFSLQKEACPGELVSTDSADVCWKAPQLTSSMGVIRLSYKITADLGDPTNANGDDIIFYFDDVNHYRDTDGGIKLGSKDQASTDVGESQASGTFNFA